MALAALFAKTHEEKLAGGDDEKAPSEHWEDDATYYAKMTRSGTSALITASASAHGHPLDPRRKFTPTLRRSVDLAMSTRSLEVDPWRSNGPTHFKVLKKGTGRAFDVRLAEQGEPGHPCRCVCSCTRPLCEHLMFVLLRELHMDVGHWALPKLPDLEARTLAQILETATARKTGALEPDWSRDQHKAASHRPVPLHEKQQRREQAAYQKWELSGDPWPFPDDVPVHPRAFHDVLTGGGMPPADLGAMLRPPASQEPPQPRYMHASSRSARPHESAAGRALAATAARREEEDEHLHHDASQDGVMVAVDSMAATQARHASSRRLAARRTLGSAPRPLAMTLTHAGTHAQTEVPVPDLTREALAAADPFLATATYNGTASTYPWRRRDTSNPITAGGPGGQVALHPYNIKGGRRAIAPATVLPAGMDMRHPALLSASNFRYSLKELLAVWETSTDPIQVSE